MGQSAFRVSVGYLFETPNHNPLTGFCHILLSKLRLKALAVIRRHLRCYTMNLN